MLYLSPSVYEALIAHCRRAYPKEACGILAGARRPSSGGEGERRVAHIYPMRNVEDSPIGYAMDPKEQLQVEKAMRTANQCLLGIYHSHTASAAYPSSVDVTLAISPDVSYVLVSLQSRETPDLKGYRIDGARVTPEPVVLLEDDTPGSRRIATGGAGQV